LPLFLNKSPAHPQGNTEKKRFEVEIVISFSISLTLSFSFSVSLSLLYFWTNFISKGLAERFEVQVLRQSIDIYV